MTDDTTMAGVMLAVLKAVKPPVLVAEAELPAEPLVPSQSNIVTVGLLLSPTVPSGSQRMQSSCARSKALLVLGVEKSLQALQSVEYCHFPVLLVLTAVIATPIVVAAASASATTDETAETLASEVKIAEIVSPVLVVESSVMAPRL